MAGPPESVDSFFGPGGRLSGLLPHFEYRPQQHELASAAHAVFTRGGSLLAEAGTGTGKTLGYLIPAAMSGRTTIVSTGTRNLQEQISLKDMPVVERIWPGLRWTCLKGRSNYLCSLRLRESARRPFLPGGPEALFLERVSDWAARTETGDRAELAWLPDDDPLWAWVSAEHESCLGNRCPMLAGCFLTRARRRAASSDLVVVNHHLLLSEAAMAEAGMGLLPDSGALVVDEAHLIEEVATRSLGVEIQTAQLGRFYAEASTLLAGRPRKEGSNLARRGFELLDGLLSRVWPEDGSRTLDAETHRDALEQLGSTARLLEELAGALDPLAGESPEAEGSARKARRLAEAAVFIRELADPGFIYWAERRGGAAGFYASPVDVSVELPRVLFSRFESVLLTSATLAVGGSFEYLKSRLGLAGAEELIEDSPFDYASQAVLYVPKVMPDPNEPDFARSAAAEILSLLGLTEGRAFVLCTSRRNMDAIAGFLAGDGRWRVLRQGDAPRSVLLTEFTASPRAVLVATVSFWQGVDVPGEALSAVIVDRLPFASPEDPVTRGRIDHIGAREGNPFREYQLPTAVIMLKQGLGRLIRRRTDRGLLAVLDPRIRTRSYGRTFMGSLPRMKVLGDFESLKAAYLALGKAEALSQE